MADDMTNVGGLEADFRIDTSSIPADLGVVNDLIKESEASLRDYDAGLNRAASSHRNLGTAAKASASESMDALNEVANMMLAMYAKEEAAAEKAEAAEDARLARVEAAYFASLARQEAAAEAAALKEAERQAKLVADYEASEAKRAAAAEAAALKEADRQAKLVADYEASEQRRAQAAMKADNEVLNMMLAMDAREEASRAKSEAQEDARLARVEAAYFASLARQDAAAEAAALKEAERIARNVAAYEEAEERKAKAAEGRAVEGGNFVLGNMTIQPAELQALIAAEQADVIAKREMANAAAGAAREQAHLNQVLRVGMLESFDAEPYKETAKWVQWLGGRSVDATPAVQNFGNAQQQASMRSQAFGRGLMQLGYVVDDIRYGFAAVVNNIAPITQSFAMAAGASARTANAIAATAQIIGVLGYEAYTHWDKIRELLLEGIEIPKPTGVEAFKDELKELEKAIDEFRKKGKVFSAEEKADFDKKVKRAGVLREEIKEEEDVKKVTGGLSKKDSERASAFAEAVRESGGENAFIDLVESYETQKVAPKEAEESLVAGGMKRQEAKKRAETGLVYDAPSNELVTPEVKARREFSRASRGDSGARDRIATDLDEGSATGKSPFAAKIRELSPEVKARKKLDEDLKKFYEDDAKQVADNAKQVADNRKKAETEAEAEDRGFQRGVHENAQRIAPDLKERADREMQAAERDARARADAEKAFGPPRPVKAGKVKSDAEESLARDLMDRGMNETTAREAARQEIDRASKEDPDKRDARIKADNLRAAREAVPEIDKFAQDKVLNGLIRGGNREDIEEEVARKLMDDGKLNDRDAREKAKDVVAEADEDVRKRSGRLAGRGRGDDGEERKPSSSEVYNVSDLTHRIQSAVGDGGEPKKQTALQERMVTSLEKLAAQPAVKVAVN